MTSDNEHRPRNPLAGQAAPRLSLVANPGSKDELRIECRRVVTLIGSRTGCKITLSHARVAPVHAAIINNGETLLAVDLVTKSGTLLNDLKMEHEALTSGDVLTIGPWEFLVEIQEPAPTGEADVHPFGLDPPAELIVLEEMDKQRTLRPDREICILGRRNGCDIVIPNTSVSRVHAILFRYFGHPALFDLLSQDGTIVNDKPIGFRRLRNGDVLTIGDARFRVHATARSAVTKPAPREKDTERPSGGRRKHEPDTIDIHETVSSQRWRIAENVEKTSRKN